MAIYMKYDVINGDVTEAGHTQWIELNSFQWGVGRGISSPVGGSADREASSPSVSEIVTTKPNDVASPPLLTEALVGEGKLVTIDFTKTEKGTQSVYIKYVLTNTMISGYSTSSGGDRPSESISLNFTKIEFTETNLKPDGTVGDPVTVGYDLSTAKTT